MVNIEAPSYEPFGDELTSHVAYWQAAATLDVAVYYAAEKKDVSALMDISAMWMSLAKILGSETGEDEEEVIPMGSKPFGFGNAIKTEEDEDARDGDTEDPQG